MQSISGKALKVIALATLIGVVIRLFCLPFAYDYDMYHWGVIVQNINSGNGLYELTGYFYTPVWGYLIGFCDLIYNSICSLDSFGIRVEQFFPLEGLDVKHIATVTTPLFNAAMKIPLIICDVVVGFFIYSFVKEKTNDIRSAIIAFAFWFLCPVVVYMSGVMGMFDTFAALLCVLSLILIMKEHYFASGFMIAIAALLKLFPAVFIILFIAYILRRYKDDRTAASRGIAFSFIGIFAAVALIMMPNILESNVADTLTFITDRAGRGFSMDTVVTLVGGILAVILVLYFCFKMYKSTGEDVDKSLLKYSVGIIASTMLVSINPQYVIMVVPFLALYMVCYDGGYTKCWWLIGVGAFIAAIGLNFTSIFMSTATFMGWPSFSFIVDTILMSGSPAYALTIVPFGYLLTYAGMILLILFTISDSLGSKYPNFKNKIDAIRCYRRGVE